MIYISKNIKIDYKIFVALISVLWINSFANKSAKEVINDQIPSVIPQEIIADWEDFDSVTNNYSAAIEKIKNKLPEKYREKVISGVTKEDYISACHVRRVALMEYCISRNRRILFARHHDFAGPIIGFLEEMNSDGFVTNMGKWGLTQCESKPSTYKPGAALCIAQFDNYYPTFSYLIEDKKGVIKDPCISFDGKKVLFAWSQDNNGYHIWETEIANPQNTRQLTRDPDGLVVSDYEPCYLQNGDIIFNSSRCFGFVECYNNMTSNFFIMNKDGKYLRRIGYDQVHTFYPVLMDDGKILYSRWEYNDRNVINCFGLFTMNPDGTQQKELFGNQTEWPATFIHARPIHYNGIQQIISVIGGHKSPYAGDLVLINTSKATNGLSAIQRIAPLRNNPNVSYVGLNGNIEEYNFQNPFPFVDGERDVECFLVSWRKNEKEKYRIYFMDIFGNRELVAWDTTKSLSQPMSLNDRHTPDIPNYMANYTQNKAYVSMENAYYGSGTGDSVVLGTIKKLRLIALEYRTDPAFGNTGSQGYQMTPLGRWTCSWEAKHIIGEIDLKEDGSASFEVPPRTPLYIQLVDDKGRMIQTMRSWMTLQPGEIFSCFGCHEDKMEGPISENPSLSKTFLPLRRFYDIDSTGYFSYPAHIQPILDKNCVKSGCHDETHKALDLRGDKIWTGTLDADNRNAFRFWNRSYINLTDPAKKYVSFIDVNTTAAGLRPNSIGSQKSKVMNMLLEGHNDVSLTAEEFEKMAAWIDLCIPHSGTYTDDMREEDAAKYRMRLERRKKHEKLEADNIKAFIDAGQYAMYGNESGVRQPDDDYTYTAAKEVKTDIFKASFCSSSKKITFHLPSAGQITIVDLHGRQIKKLAITDKDCRQNVGRSFYFNVPAGIYLVKFRGVSATGEKMVSVL